MSSKSDTARKLAELVRICQGMGWRVADNRRHWIVYPPKPYPSISIPKTPSDHRSFENNRAMVNRILRGLGKPEVMK